MRDFGLSNLFRILITPLYFVLWDTRHYTSNPRKHSDTVREHIDFTNAYLHPFKARWFFKVLVVLFSPPSPSP